MKMAYEPVFHALVEEVGEGPFGWWFSLVAFLVVVEAECHESEFTMIEYNYFKVGCVLPKFEVSFRLLFLFSSQLLVSRLDLHLNWQV